ncbi:MAG TPA: protein-methionine-sulfoxide reductase heme-binding subunit MsrQ [Candidatus Acidoferrum sp.]|nr:protein-methionine-sulfoxide reductase heme-binding subunit MsrQ [Candidatus Acidoferrum sp.]
MSAFLRSKYAKALLFAACLLPLGNLLLRALHGELTANPIEFLTHATGDWTLRFLLLTLAITPFRRILRLPDLIRFRRMLGLFAFFYGCLHFTMWFGVDKFFNLRDMVDDVEKRRFITVGMLGFFLMVPLAITSTAGWIRRLGGKRWRLLHRAIYASAIAGVIHYFWLVKSDIHKPLDYACVVGVLLAMRIAAWIYDKRKHGARELSAGQPTTAEGL